MSFSTESLGEQSLPFVDIESSEASTGPEEQAFGAVNVAQLRKLVAFAFELLHVSFQTELSVTVIGEAEMERLHIEWMDLEGPTDVMSFPMDEMRPGTADELAEGTLGDIALCPTVAARQAESAGHSTADELCLLLLHGILHCLGYDHATTEQEREMFSLQRNILEKFLGHPAPVETRH